MAPPSHTMTCLTVWLLAWRKWPWGNNMQSASTLQWSQVIGRDPPPHPIAPTPAPLSSTRQDMVLPGHCHGAPWRPPGQGQSQTRGCRAPHPARCPGASVAPEASLPQGWIFGWLFTRWQCTHCQEPAGRSARGRVTFTLRIRQSWLLRPSLSCSRKAAARAGGWESGAGTSASAQRERAPGEIRRCRIAGQR